MMNLIFDGVFYELSWKDLREVMEQNETYSSQLLVDRENVRELRRQLTAERPDLAGFLDTIADNWMGIRWRLVSIVLLERVGNLNEFCKMAHNAMDGDNNAIEEFAGLLAGVDETERAYWENRLNPPPSRGNVDVNSADSPAKFRCKYDEHLSIREVLQSPPRILSDGQYAKLKSLVSFFSLFFDTVPPGIYVYNKFRPSAMDKQITSICWNVGKISNEEIIIAIFQDTDPCLGGGNETLDKRKEYLNGWIITASKTCFIKCGYQHTEDWDNIKSIEIQARPCSVLNHSSLVETEPVFTHTPNISPVQSDRDPHYPFLPEKFCKHYFGYFSIITKHGPSFTAPYRNGIRYLLPGYEFSLFSNRSGDRIKQLNDRSYVDDGMEIPVVAIPNDNFESFISRLNAGAKFLFEDGSSALEECCENLIKFICSDLYNEFRKHNNLGDELLPMVQLMQSSIEGKASNVPNTGVNACESSSAEYDEWCSREINEMRERVRTGIPDPVERRKRESNSNLVNGSRTKENTDISMKIQIRGVRRSRMPESPKLMRIGLKLSRAYLTDTKLYPDRIYIDGKLLKRIDILEDNMIETSIKPGRHELKIEGHERYSPVRGFHGFHGTILCCQFHTNIDVPKCRLFTCEITATEVSHDGNGVDCGPWEEVEIDFHTSCE